MQPSEQDQLVAGLDAVQGVGGGKVDFEPRAGCALDAWLGASASARSVEQTTPIGCITYAFSSPIRSTSHGRLRWLRSSRASREAARCVRAAGAAAVRVRRLPELRALLNPVAAEALAMLDDRESARPYAEAATVVAGMFEGSARRATAGSATASVAAAGGDSVRAREAAADLYDRAGQPYWLQRSRAQAEAV